MLPPCAAMIDWQMAQADANSCILGAEEAVEDVLKVRGGNAWPIVENGEDERAVFIDRSLNFDSTALSVATA